MNREMIYLDHAAATPMDEHVLSSMLPYFIDNFYNPSSPYQPAVSVKQSYEDAKHQIAICIGASSSEIIMTAGATESINLAFCSIEGHVVTSNIEHPAVLESAKRHEHTLVLSDEFGYVSAQKIKDAIRPDTQLVSIALANNELGTIQPLREIATIIKQERLNRLDSGNKTPIYLHSDASQGAGLLDMNVARLGVDMLTLNAGKVYGPKQVGLLWIASHVVIGSQILGGGQERGLRSGTENVPGVIGFAVALKIASDHRKGETERLRKIRDDLQSKLTQAFPKAVVSGHKKHRLAGHLHISFPDIDGERLVFILENRGVLIATGSACAANKGTRSHVLSAIGLSPALADGSVRITLGRLSDADNVNKAYEIIREEVEREYRRTNRA
jgi:cysteine desulfurase